MYYEKSFNKVSSSIKGERYFISKDGNRNPYAELKASIEIFKKNNLKESELYCQFPARNLILHLNWPKEIRLHDCPDFNIWKEGINAGDLFLVYSSAYPNNPASMFGHTFLRFNRKSKTQSKIAQEILGYSFAYQAKTDPKDNAFMYTFKGLLGGYYTYLNIDPHYMNIGIYNNSESRDLWEYKISLTQDEKELLIRHLWEISIAGAFDYYFLDENCSTLMIKTLEVVKLDWDLKTKKTVFVVPGEVVKEIATREEASSVIQRLSIQKKIYQLLDKLNTEQKVRLKKTLINVEQVKKENDPLILDTIIEYWKFQNYKQKTKLSENDKNLMYASLEKRSKLLTESFFQYSLENKNMAPHLSHDISRIGLDLTQGKSNIFFRYGFHSFEDQSLGNDGNSHFSFLKTSLTRENEKYYLSQIELLDILSLQDFYPSMPELSWKANLNHQKTMNEAKTSLSGGIGLSQRKKLLQSYFLIGGEISQDYILKSSYLKPNYFFGLKYDQSENLWYNLSSKLRHQDKTQSLDYKISASYFIKKKNQLLFSLYMLKDKENFRPGLVFSSLF